MKYLIPATRRERVTNYGDTVVVTGKLRPTAFTVQKNDGSPMTITAQVEEFFVPAAALGTADFRPFLHVEWGHGASMARSDFDVTFRQRIPLVCSTVEVQAFIAALPFPGQTGRLPAVPDAARAKIRAFVSEGLDGTRLFPSVWITQTELSAGVLADEQARLATLRAFNPATSTANASLFLLLFDQDTTPSGGEMAVDGMPLPFNTRVLGGLANLPLGETRGFVHGIAWAVSSTPFANTPLDMPIFIVAELLQ
jgi:hypothetical protein